MELIAHICVIDVNCMRTQTNWNGMEWMRCWQIYIVLWIGFSIVKSESIIALKLRRFKCLIIKEIETIHSDADSRSACITCWFYYVSVLYWISFSAPINKHVTMTLVASWFPWLCNEAIHINTHINPVIQWNWLINNVLIKRPFSWCHFAAIFGNSIEQK